MKTECPVCQIEGAKLLFVKDGYPVHRCDRCGFVFVHPTPSAELIAQHYVSNYRGASADYYPKARSRRWRAFIRSLKYIRYARGKRVLDVGCGGGFMVEAFARLGADATGLDISANSIAYARRRFSHQTFYCESLAEFRARNLTFDFVFSSEVLEHLPGAGDFMQLLQDAVVAGGYVYLSAPDAGHETVPVRLEEWSDICPPEHLQFFNAANLDLMFRRYGFHLHRRERSKTPAHSVIYRRDADSV